MVVVTISERAGGIHPLHAILLSFALPLFLGALISDWAYASTFHVQWINFSAWLIAGALVPAGLTVLWALVDAIRGRFSLWPAIYLAVLVVMWVLGFINALVHARDAMATMPTGLLLSVIVTLLALLASWIGYSGARPVEVAR